MLLCRIVHTASQLSPSCRIHRPYRRLTFLSGLFPPPNASGSTVLYPLSRRLSLRTRRGGLCSSITSTISSSLGAGLLVSSRMTVSLRVSLRGLRCRDTSITSLCDLLEGGRRGELRRGELLRGERERLRDTTTSSSTEVLFQP